MLAHRWTWRKMDQKRNLERDTVIDANLVNSELQLKWAEMDILVKDV